MTTARLALLALACIACLASSGSNSNRRADPGPNGWWCHNEQSAQGQIASMCRPDQNACESERAAAESGGLAVSTCAQVAQVACFQIGGDPSPQAEWCAASLDDCEFWRSRDLRKNGQGGQSCAWH